MPAALLRQINNMKLIFYQIVSQFRNKSNKLSNLVYKQKHLPFRALLVVKEKTTGERGSGKRYGVTTIWIGAVAVLFVSHTVPLVLSAMVSVSPPEIAITSMSLFISTGVVLQG